MKQIEKLDINRFPEPDDSGPLLASLLFKLNEAITLINEQQKEIEWLKERVYVLSLKGVKL